MKTGDRNSRKRANGFNTISISKYVKLHAQRNQREDPKELTNRLRRALEAKEAGAECHCGEPIWALGSAEIGNMCFTCATGEAMPHDDYEITHG